MDTLPETNSSHLKIGHPKTKVVFQPSIFRCYLSFREGNWVFCSPYFYRGPITPNIPGIRGRPVTAKSQNRCHFQRHMEMLHLQSQRVLNWPTGRRDGFSNQASDLGNLKGWGCKKKHQIPKKKTTSSWWFQPMLKNINWSNPGRGENKTY